MPITFITVMGYFFQNRICRQSRKFFKPRPLKNFLKQVIINLLKNLKLSKIAGVTRQSSGSISAPPRGEKSSDYFQNRAPTCNDIAKKAKCPVIKNPPFWIFLFFVVIYKYNLP